MLQSPVHGRRHRSRTRANTAVSPRNSPPPARATRAPPRRSFDRQNNQFGEFRRLGEAADAALRILRRPVGQFGRLARAHHYVVTMLQKASAQDLRHIARPKHPNFHAILLLSILWRFANASTGRRRYGTGSGGDLSVDQEYS